MKMRHTAIALAVIGGTLALAVPATSRAADVGYYIGPSCAGFTPGNFAGAITAAGHTPVAVATLDAAGVTGLEGLVIETCSAAPVANASINAAVANGMALVVNAWNAAPGSGAGLPGAPALALTTYYSGGFCAVDVSIPVGSPVSNGPGGMLNNSSLDSGVYCALDSFATSASLPAGAIPFATTTDPTQVGAFGYQSGQGLVAFSSMSLASLIPGGQDSGNAGSLSAGLNTYLINAIAWAVAGSNPGPTTTCASEGYTGTKLTWCKNICENGLTGQALDTWIHRWINRYRDLPYCAREEGGGEEQPPQGQPQ